MKKKSLKLHAQVAEIAFILLFPSVFYMLYSAGLGLNLPFLNWLLFFHKLFGILALGFGLLFVSNRWRWKGKKYMV
ncbi:MAG: hypothetical protein PHD41_09335, partial [Methanosarcinaceae archaeon]|nr:hypothetical protein [Methanosarcinaceae archaeon]